MSDRVVVHLPPMPQPKDFGLDVQVKNDTPAAERYDNALESLGARRQRHRQADRLQEKEIRPAAGTPYAISTSGGIFMFCSSFGADVFVRWRLIAPCQATSPVVTTVEAQSRPVNRDPFPGDGSQQRRRGHAPGVERLGAIVRSPRLEQRRPAVGRRSPRRRAAQHELGHGRSRAEPLRAQRELDARGVHHSRSQSRQPADQQRMALRPRDVPCASIAIATTRST